jgi:hypothetical protein
MDSLLAEAVQPPPVQTCLPCPDLGLEERKSITRLRWRVKRPIGGVKDDLQIIREEAVLLNQLLYKIHNRFRNDKGYKDLRILDRTVRKFLAHDFLRSVEGLLTFLPTSDTTTPSGLPTSAMARHAALQLYGAAALLHRMEALTLNCGLLAVQRLNLGHFWGVAAQQLACVGRGWLVGRHLLASLHPVYAALVSLAPLLAGPAVLELPGDLDSFLPEDVLEQVRMKEAAGVDLPATKRLVSVDSFLDIGVPIKRPKLDESEVEVVDNTESNSKPPNINEECNAKPSKDVLADIHSLDELKQFIEAETKTRKVAKKTSFTRKLKQEDWKRIRSEVLKAVNEKTPNKSLKLCRKILRSAIADATAT